MSFAGRFRFAHAVASTLGASVGVLADAAVGRLQRERANGHFWRWTGSLCRLGGVELHVEGKERLDPSRGWLFMSNHRSYWDIPAIGSALEPIPLRMVAKRELFRVPLWGAAMLKAEILPLDRSDRQAAIRDLDVAADKLKGGLSVWIAPEGTRSRDGSLGRFKKGGFMLALKTGCPIVPVGVAGTERIAPVDRFEIVRGGPVAVVVGEPIDVAAYAGRDDGREALMEDVRVALTTLLARAESIVANQQGDPR
jgi:1-acyl-sn-glycerol-3-phosphate acyltransferase